MHELLPTLRLRRYMIFRCALANERTQYFEAAMPKDAFEFGMKNGNLLDRGRVIAPKGPGLGIEVDWDHLAEADFYRKSAAVAPTDQ